MVQTVAAVLVVVVWGIAEELAKPVMVWTAFEEMGDAIGVSWLSSVVIAVVVDDTPKNESCCGGRSSCTDGKSDSWGRCSEVVDLADWLVLLLLFHDAHRWRCSLELLFLLRGRSLLGLGVVAVSVILSLSSSNELKGQ